MKIAILSILFFIVPILSYKPVVLIHGVMTGSASMELIKLRIEEQHPGTIVYNVNRFESWSSLETMWHQVLEIGMDIANISSQYPEGINLIGYSQGGLIARGIVETFPNVSVSTFISLSSPQAGQYGAGFLHLVFPGLVKDTVYELFYSRVGQHTSVGNYWNDPYHQSLYESYSVPIPALYKQPFKVSQVSRFQEQSVEVEEIGADRRSRWQRHHTLAEQSIRLLRCEWNNHRDEGSRYLRGRQDRAPNPGRDGATPRGHCARSEPFQLAYEHEYCWWLFTTVFGLVALIFW